MTVPRCARLRKSVSETSRFPMGRRSASFGTCSRPLLRMGSMQGEINSFS